MIKLKLDNVALPKYQTAESAGFDVIANTIIKVYSGDRELIGNKLEKVQKDFIEKGIIKMRPFERMLFGTGLTLAGIPKDTELQVRGRSGVSLKRGLLTVLGTVDADYRSEIGVILQNSNNFLAEVTRGERIAQLVCNKIDTSEIVEVDTIVDTARGEGGFGSSGKF
jgi:dUTP pyrophosphatase